MATTPVKGRAVLREPDRDVTGSVARWLPGLFVAGIVVFVLVAHGVSMGEVVRYASYWVVGILVPGAVVHRLLRGRPASLVEELGLAAATGVSLEVVVALALNLVGWDALAHWWWVPLYVVLAVSPALRRAIPRGWRGRETRVQAWLLAAVAALVAIGLVGGFRAAGLPPEASTVNIDRWWHLSLVREMLKPGLPMDPQVAVEPLVYHWFSHLHLAVATATSGVDPTVVLLRLWPVPIALTMVALVVALGRRVSGSSWGGPVSVWLTFVAIAGGVLWPPSRLLGGGVMSLSPSQSLSIVTTLAVGIALVGVARRQVDGRQAAWLVLVTLAMLGMKPSAVPVLACGMAVATVAGTVVDRRLHRPLAAGLALLIAALGVSFSITRTPGNVTLFGSLHSIWPYRDLVADGPRAMSQGLLVDSLVGGRAWLVALVAITVVVVGHSPRLLGLGVLVHPDTRQDPVGWLLAGVHLAGWGAVALVDHPARSQFFFLGTVAAFGSVAAAWLAVEVVRGLQGDGGRALPSGTAEAERTVDGLMVAVAFLAGTALGWLARDLVGWLPGRLELGPLDQAAVPILVVLAGLVGLALAAACVPGAHGRRRVAAVVVIATIGLTTPGALQRSLAETARLWTEAGPVKQDSIDYLTRGEQEAALWLGANSAPQDLVATNVHCRPRQQSVPGCDARGYWLSALSGRRVLLGGWAYTDEAHALHGNGGRSFAHQSSPWPDLFEVSQAAVQAPSSAVFDRLRERGVDWLVGDRRAGEISPRVADFAQPRFSNEVVTIWQIGS